jgi:hypothetical protein
MAVQLQLSIRRIHHTIINISLHIIPPIIWKWDRLPTRAKENKRHNKNHDLGATIQTCTKHIIKLQKPFRLISSQIMLAPESDEEEGNDGGVDASYQPSDVPADDRHVQVVEAEFGEEAVQEVGGEGREEADYEAEGNPSAVESALKFPKFLE